MLTVYVCPLCGVPSAYRAGQVVHECPSCGKLLNLTHPSFYPFIVETYTSTREAEAQIQELKLKQAKPRGGKAGFKQFRIRKPVAAATSEEAAM